MKSMLKLLVVAATAFALNGCFYPEKIENHVRYVDGKTPPQITVIWRNISSDAESDQKLKEDFEKLIEDPDSTDVFVGFEKDIIIKEWQVYLEEGQLNLRVSGIPKAGPFEDIASNGERMLVLNRNEAGLVKTNGTLLKTEGNYIIVWPESLKELSWSNNLLPEEADTDDLKRWRQNRPKLIKMFEAYKQQIGK